MTITLWSTNPGDNDDADSANGIEWLYRQPAPQTNNSGRAMMAEIRKDFDFDHSTNGYQYYPGGMVQWGKVTTGFLGGIVIFFPKPFVAPPAVTCSVGGGVVTFSGMGYINIQDVTATSFYAAALQDDSTSQAPHFASGRTVWWRAIGPR